MSNGRITISNGRYVQFSEVWTNDYFDNVSCTYWMDFDTFTPDGKPLASDTQYRGAGNVGRRDDGRTWIVLGSAETTWLEEFMIADQPTPESLAKFNDFEAGFRAGADTRKRRRMKRDASEVWCDGFKYGRKARKEQQDQKNDMST